MFRRKRHLIARKLADEFKERLIITHGDLIKYPLQYLNLKVAISEHFNLIVDEIPGLTVKKIKEKLKLLGLDLPLKSYDEYLELAGFMYVYNGLNFIFIEENDSEERKKFSLAHETSHFLNEYFKVKLKSKGEGTLSLFTENNVTLKSPIIAKRCTKNDVFKQIYGKEENDTVKSAPVRYLKELVKEKKNREEILKERICDWFAAELLMPIDVLKRLEADWVKNKFTFSDIVSSVQENFHVSKMAARVRAEDLKLGEDIQENLI